MLFAIKIKGSIKKLPVSLWNGKEINKHKKKIKN